MLEVHITNILSTLLMIRPQDDQSRRFILLNVVFTSAITLCANPEKPLELDVDHGIALLELELTFVLTAGPPMSVYAATSSALKTKTSNCNLVNFGMLHSFTRTLLLVKGKFFCQ